MKNTIEFDTLLGKIFISDNGEAITELHIGGDIKVTGSETPLLKRAKAQVLEYFEGKRKDFDLPLHTESTDFIKSVWAALQEIPYGETVSYKYIAEQVHSPKACRAVGMANNKNPIAIIVPCHRVIGADKKLVGYAGGLDLKKKLLDLEQSFK